MPSFFKPNPNFERELKAEPEYAEGLAAHALPAKEAAQSFAPVESGDYRDGIKVKVVKGQTYLVGEDWKSVFIEYGTDAPGPTPVFAPLRRGLRAAGFELREQKKPGK